MKGSAGIVAILLLAVVLQMPASASGPLPHASVAIRSDADWTAANGVVSGTGTTLNPYVISGWHFTSTSGTTLLITNTSASFVLRDNVFEGSTGVWFGMAASAGLVINNTFNVRSSGIIVDHAQAEIRENAFISYAGQSHGVALSDSSSLVINNTFTFVGWAVIANFGSPIITGNDIHAATSSIYVSNVVLAEISENVMTDVNDGIYVYVSTRVSVRANIVIEATECIKVWISKDIDVTQNNFSYATSWCALIESSSGNFTFNTIVDGAQDGLQMWHSPILVANNNITNNLGIGINAELSDATIRANVLMRNGVGIYLWNWAVVHLENNVLVNNAIGIDLPYGSRQSIPYLSGNVVNGVAIDAAGSQVYFYKSANVTISGQVRDSGFSAGFYGSLTAQGNVVLYEVDNALIVGSTLSHARVGVTAVNSFNVVVEGSQLLDVQTGLLAQTDVVPSGWGPVPFCAASVKNSTINITIDPPYTVGVDARGCLVNVKDNLIATMETGIKIDATSQGNVSGNVVLGARWGIVATGLPDSVTILGNTFANGRVGAHLHATNARFLGNTVTGNLRAGVELHESSHPTLAGNLITLNGGGVIDLEGCAMILTTGGCSSLDSTSDVITANRGDGVRVNGTATIRGSVMTGNTGSGARLASATLLNVQASGNGGDGASVTGTFAVRGSTFSGNGNHGLRVVGTGEIRASNFTFNVHAGLRASATSAVAADINASDNEDGILFDELLPSAPSVPPLSVPDILSLIPTPASQQPDPLDVHRSTLLHNSRDAIRSGGAIVNATHNYFGGTPKVSVLDTVGAFQNGVSPTARFVPWFTDAAMTTTGPVDGI